MFTETSPLLRGVEFSWVCPVAFPLPILGLGLQTLTSERAPEQGSPWSRVHGHLSAVGPLSTWYLAPFPSNRRYRPRCRLAPARGQHGGACDSYPRHA